MGKKTGVAEINTRWPFRFPLLVKTPLRKASFTKLSVLGTGMFSLILSNLGITITDNLDWGQHVSGISCKATKTVGFLRRNLELAPRHTKEVAYKTLVRPQLKYAAPIWHPYHDTQIAQVKKVQRTAARWTCRRWRNTSSIGDMLDELGWPSLEDRREQSSLAFSTRFTPVQCLLKKISI